MPYRGTLGELLDPRLLGPDQKIGDLEACVSGKRGLSEQSGLGPGLLCPAGGGVWGLGLVDLEEGSCGALGSWILTVEQAVGGRLGS